MVRSYSSRIINELKTFVWVGGRPQAMRGYNDDLIMACAIACWIKDTVFEINKREVEYKKSFLSCFTSTASKLNSSIPGMKQYKPIILR